MSKTLIRETEVLKLRSSTEKIFTSYKKQNSIHIFQVANKVHCSLNSFLPLLSFTKMLMLKLQYHTLAMATCSDNINTETGIPRGINQKSYSQEHNTHSNTNSLSNRNKKLLSSTLCLLKLFSSFI